MNSVSKDYYKKETPSNEKNNDCDKHCNHSVPGEVLFRCNNGSLGATTVDFATNPTQILNLPIASVTIDTSCLGCPNVLISFDGILDVADLLLSFIEATLTFTLFKICKESIVREAISTFNFSVTSFSPLFGVVAQESHTLSFQYSPCGDICNDCCIYILELTRITNFVASTISVSVNGKLCALAVGEPC